MLVRQQVARNISAPKSILTMTNTGAKTKWPTKRKYWKQALAHKILVCFHDNSQHQQSRAKPKWSQHSTTVVAIKERLSDPLARVRAEDKNCLEDVSPPPFSFICVCHLLSSCFCFTS